MQNKLEKSGKSQGNSSVQKSGNHGQVSAKLNISDTVSKAPQEMVQESEFQSTLPSAKNPTHQL